MAKYEIKDGVGIIPEGTTAIEPNAFFACTELKSVVIPDSVTSIGEKAFYRCSGLTSVVIGNSVERIGEMAFRCENIESIKVAEGNPVYDSRNDCNAIIETKNNKLVLGCAKTVIPTTVAEIGLWAFFDAINAEIAIHEGIKKIERMAFKLNGVNRIKVAEGNTVYDSRGDCNAIIETETNSLVVGCAKTVIPETVTKINGFAFYECSDLKEIIIPTSVTEIDNFAFYGCKELTDIVIPDFITEIDMSAFDRSGLKSVVIGKKVKRIGENAFRCDSLETITFRGSVKDIDEDAFDDCDSVKVINVPAGKSSVYAGRLNRGNFPGSRWDSWEGLLVEQPTKKSK